MEVQVNQNGQAQDPTQAPANQPEAQAPANQEAVETKSVVLENAEELPLEIREGIEAKIAELQAKTKLKRIFPIVVQGDDYDEKPWYIGYFKRPEIGAYSMFMNKVQQDSIQASMMLAQNCFIEGDKEMLSGDIFIFGTMNQLSTLVENRHAVLVKVSSAGK